MAAPHVAGIVALMQGAAPELMKPADVETFIVATSRMFPVAPDRFIGAGIANADAAVAAAMAGVLPQAPPLRVASGQLMSKLAAAPGQSHAFVISVPEGATSVSLRTFGGTGDADMWLSYGIPVEFDAGNPLVSTVRPGNNGYLSLKFPAAGDYYVLIKPTRAYQGLYFQASVQ